MLLARHRHALMSTASSTRTLTLALCQMAVGSNKEDNLDTAERLISAAVSRGAELVVLPECFLCPYGNQYFPEYAEDMGGTSPAQAPARSPSAHRMAQLAAHHSIHLVAGSMPERAEDGTLYNTSLTFGPDGSVLAKFRKLHLFDIDVPGGITFKESDTLSPGDTLATVDMGKCTVGVGICFDIRFPELASLYQQQGCDLLVYPGAFNMTTGPLHWELLARARAVDNQLYVAVCSPARDPDASYVAWGHSMVVDPWGTVMEECEEDEKVLVVEIDLDKVQQTRQQVPSTSGRRVDLYATTWKGNS